MWFDSFVPDRCLSLDYKGLVTKSGARLEIWRRVIHFVHALKKQAKRTASMTRVNPSLINIPNSLPVPICSKGKSFPCTYHRPWMLQVNDLRFNIVESFKTTCSRVNKRWLLYLLQLLTRNLQRSSPCSFDRLARYSCSASTTQAKDFFPST